MLSLLLKAQCVVNLIYRFKKKTFEAKDRCLLTYEILQRTIFSQKIENARIFRTANNEASDDKVGIERLLADGTFLAAYPLHEVWLVFNLASTQIYLALTLRTTLMDLSNQ